MGGPGRSRDQIAVNVGIVECLARWNEIATADFNFRSDGGIGAARLALDDASRRQDLRAVTNCGKRFVGFGEMTNDLQHACVQSKVFRCPTTGNDQGVV